MRGDCDATQNQATKVPTGPHAVVGASWALLVGIGGLSSLRTVLRDPYKDQKPSNISNF